MRDVLATPAAAGLHPDLVEACRVGGVGWHVLQDEALGALAETVTPQGVVAVCAYVDVELSAVLARRPRLLAVCAEVRDPGNAGTVIRCADAAGADAVVVAGDSVDPYNGKVVRASAGSLFHLPLVVHQDPADVVRRMRAAGLTVLATSSDGEVDLDEAIEGGLLGRPTAWLFGNEAHGLPTDVAGLADHRVRVPIHGRAESLNLASAAAVCLYASARALGPAPTLDARPQTGLA